MPTDYDRVSDEGRFFNRRDFCKLSAAMAAAGGAGALQQAAAQGQRKPEPPPNAMAPAIQFQAAPSGTGTYLESIGKPVRRQIKVEPWKGDKPKSAEEIAFLPVHRQAALIQDGKLSPVELTDIYLKRLKQLDPKLLCAVNLMEESARKDAQHAEREIKQGKYRGPLHGIPWGVKDLFSTKGVITTWGAKPFAERVIDEDAAIVVRLREAGAILIAKLSTGTFAQGDQWYRGMTRNPWNLKQGSSGSSAGPGSATAAGCVGFAIGTETRGSIVSPSRRCGLSALRPTFGRVTRHGCMTLSWSMDKVGPMCRTIEDCALVFNAIHGADAKDPATLTAPFQFEREPDLSKLSIGYTRGASKAFLKKLTDLGAKPKPIPNPPSYRTVGRILAVESATAFDDFLTRNLDEKMVRKSRVVSWRASRNVTAIDYLNAQRRRLALMKEMAEFMKGIDLYVSAYGDVALTNLTGHPAAIVPFQFDTQPRCITLIGNLFFDDKILSVAHAYQNATEWHRRYPKL